MSQSNCFREFIKYSSLNVLGMLGLSFYILADTFFISKGLGPNGLTALNLAIPFYSFIHGCGLMIGMGGGTRYSIQKSHGDQTAGDRAFFAACCLAGIFAVFFVLLGLLFTGPIVGLLGADEQVFSMTKTYLRVILLFSPAFLFNNVLLCFVRNDGAPQLSMAAMVTGSLSNVVLDYLLIFPCHMGILGAVLATGLAPIISMAILSSHFLRGKNGFSLRIGKVRGTLCFNIMSTGVPSLVTEVSSGVVIIAFNAIILSLQGNIGVAAYGVIANLSLVVVAVFTGIAQGIQPILSGNYGAGYYDNVRRIVGYAQISGLVLSILIYAGVFFGAGWITSVFNSQSNELLQRLAEDGLRLYFLACPFVAFNLICAVQLTSTDRPRPAQMLSLLRGFVIILPLAFLLSRFWGMTGVWCTFPVTELIVALLGMALLCRFGARKAK